MTGEGAVVDGQTDGARVGRDGVVADDDLGDWDLESAIFLFHSKGGIGLLEGLGIVDQLKACCNSEIATDTE